MEGMNEGDQATRVDLEVQLLAKLLSPAKGTSDAAMASEAGAACPAVAAADAGYKSRWRGCCWRVDSDNNVYNRAKEEAWAQYQRENVAATALSGSVAAAAASDKPKKNLLHCNIYKREWVAKECLVIAIIKVMEEVAPDMDFKLNGPDLDSHFTLEFADSRVADDMRYTFCDCSGNYKHLLV